MLFFRKNQRKIVENAPASSRVLWLSTARLAKLGAFLFAAGGVAMLVLSILFVTRPLHASAPSSNQVLNYQARLTDNNGIPLPDGAKNVKFMVYDALTGGNCEYSVRGTCGTPTAKSVTVANGHFSTLLGEAGDVAFPTGLFSGDESRFLEIQVETSAPGTYETLSPRKRIVSSLLAQNANLLDDLDTSAVGGSTAFVPVTDSSGNLVLTKDLKTVTLTIPGSAAPAASPSGQGRIYFDSTSNTFKVSQHGGAYADLIAAAGASGWTDDGTVVRLTTITDNVGIGTTIPTQKFEVTDTNKTLVGANANVAIVTSDAQAADIGGSLVFGGNRTALYTPTPFAYVAGRKENSTSDNQAGYLQFGVRDGAAASNERMRITSTGNVAIGTMSAGAKLAINSGGTNHILIGANSSSTTYNAITLNGDISDTGKLGITGGGGTDKNLYIDAPTGGSFSFRLATAAKMTLDSSGNVGIGDSSPASLLTVGNGDLFQVSSAGGVSAKSLSVTNAADHAPLQLNAGGVGKVPYIDFFFSSVKKANIYWQNTAPARLVINDQGNVTTINENGGNVGIGTSSPSGRLDVVAGAARTGTHGTTPSFYVTGTMTDGTTGPSANNIEYRHDNGTQGIGFGYNTIYQTGSNTNNALNLLSRGSSPITLNAYGYSTGNVGIGATGPSTKLDVWTSGGQGISSYAFSTVNNSFAGSPYIFLQRSRNATLGTVTTTTANDWLGAINWRGVGSNNTSYAAGQITVIQTGTSGAAEWTIPSKMIFTVGDSSGTAVDAMHILSTGHVGIGTTAPGARLHVRGDQATPGAVATNVYIEPVSDAQDTGISLLTTQTGTNREWNIRAGTGANVNTNFRIYDATAAADRLNIDASGNVGIGDTTPAALFTVGNGDKFTVDSAGTTTIGSSSSDPTGANGRMYYNTSTNKFRCFENSGWQDCDNNAGAGSALGVTQSTVTGSRAFATVYQNTTGKPLFVQVSNTMTANGTVFAYVDGTTSPTQLVSSHTAFSGWWAHMFFVVPPTYYYKVTTDASVSLQAWNESTIDGSGASQWTTSGSNIYYTTGNVGIGTTTPGYTLNVRKAISADWLTGLENTDTGGGSIYMAHGTGEGMAVNAGSDLTGTSYAFQVNKAGTTYLYAMNGGNVGIGTDNPAQKLELYKSSGTNYLQVSSGAAGGYVGTDGTNFILQSRNSADLTVYNTAGTTRLVTIQNDGDVGIGTTSPLYRLHVEGAQAMIGSGAVSVNMGSVSSVATIYGWNGTTNSAHTPLALRATSGTQLYLNTDGNVGIGTDNPSSFKLQVTGDIGPTTNDTYALGSASLRWSDVYVGPATVHIGTSATDEGTLSYNTSTNILNISTDSTTNGDIAFFTDDLYLDKSSGFVGVGNAAPAAMFSVGSASQFTVTSAGVISAVGMSVIGSSQNLLANSNSSTSVSSALPVLLLQNNDTTTDNYTSLNFRDANSTSTGGIYSKNIDHTNHYSNLELVTRGTGGYSTKLTILSDGNVGIGTTNPLTKLQVVGGTLRMDNDSAVEWGGGGNYIIGSAASNYIQIGSNNLARIRVDATGSVGIGTTAPATRLHVAGALALIGDTWVDADGTDTTGPSDVVTAIAENATLVSAAGQGLCTDSLTDPANVYKDGNGDCTPANGGTDSVILGSTAGATTTVTSAWAFNDADTDCNGDGAGGDALCAASDSIYQVGQDLYIDNAPSGVYTSGRAGIGTTTPTFNVHVRGTRDPVAITADSMSDYSVSNFIGRRSRGTVASPTAVTANTPLVLFQARGHDGTAFSDSSRASIRMVAAENWTGSANGTYMRFDTTSTGSTTNTERMRIDAAGNVGIGTTSPTVGFSLDIRGNLLLKKTDADGFSRNFAFQKDRAGAVVQNNDELGFMDFYGYDGNSYERAALIIAHVAGTPGDGDMPGSLGFYTTPDGSATSQQRMYINAAGNIGINTTSPDVGGYGTPVLTISHASGGVAELSSTATDASGNIVGRLGFAATANTGGSKNIGIILTETSGATANNRGGSMQFWTKVDGGATTEKMRIDSAGNVGIGTTSPTTKLYINATSGIGAAMNITDNTNGLLIYGNSGARLNHNLWVDGSGNGEYYMYNSAGTVTNVLTASGVSYINGGNFGIGDTTPDALFTVGSTSQFQVNSSGLLFAPNGSASAPPLSFVSDPNTGVFGTGSDVLGFATAGSERVRIDSAGNVGIGTTGPEALLHLYGGGATSDSIMTIGPNLGASTNGLNMGYGGLSFGAGQSFINAHSVTASDGKLRLLVNASTKMIIQNDGNVGINDPTPDYTLDVEKASATVAAFDRLTDDGMIIELRQDGVTEGDISVSGTTVSYNAFTGSHYAWTDESPAKGMLVTLTGENKRLHDSSSSEILYGVQASTQKNDPKIMGAYLALREPSKERGVENPHLIMAVGNADIWVTDEGGDIEAGDYLISSSLPGHAMKDDGASPTSHIVARAAESVEWSAVTPSPTDGKKHRLISIFFESFARSNSSTDLTKIEDLQTLSSDLNVNGKLLLNVRGIVGLQWSISEEGKLTTKTVEADEVKSKGYSVNATDAQKTVGRETIAAGTDAKLVNNELVTANSLIMVTFEGNPGAQWWISDKADGAFTVRLGSNAEQDISFTYWLIGVDGDIGQVQAQPDQPPVVMAPPPEPSAEGGFASGGEPESTSDPGPTDPPVDPLIPESSP